jgi:hypothetical protein
MRSLCMQAQGGVEPAARRRIGMETRTTIAFAGLLGWNAA